MLQTWEQRTFFVHQAQYDCVDYIYTRFTAAGAINRGRRFRKVKKKKDTAALNVNRVFVKLLIRHWCYYDTPKMGVFLDIFVTYRSRNDFYRGREKLESLKSTRMPDPLHRNGLPRLLLSFFSFAVIRFFCNSW